VACQSPTEIIQAENITPDGSFESRRQVTAGVFEQDRLDLARIDVSRAPDPHANPAYGHPASKIHGTVSCDEVDFALEGRTSGGSGLETIVGVDALLR